MAQPSRTQLFVAGAILLLVAVVASLGVHRYIHHNNEVRLGVFRALAVAQDLALKIPEGQEGVWKTKASANLLVNRRPPAPGTRWKPLGKNPPPVEEADTVAARQYLDSGTVTRVTILQKGLRDEVLGISRAPQLLLQLPDAADSQDADVGRMFELSGKIDSMYSEAARAGQGTPPPLGSFELVWQGEDKDRPVAVASWPVLRQGEYVGLVTVEMLHPETTPIPYESLGPLWVALLGAFGVLLWRSIKPLMALAVVSVVLVAGTAWLLHMDNSKSASAFQLERDSAATRTGVHAVLARTDGLLDLERTWREVFKDDTSVLRPSVEPDAAVSAALGGGLFFWEDAGSTGSLVGEWTWPPTLTLGLLLILAWLLLPSTAGLIWGLRTMPGVYAYIAPAMLGMAVLVLIPFVMGVGLAFFDNSYDFVGLSNFSAILFPSDTSDTNFYFTLGITILWTVLNVGLHVAIGLFMALILVSPKVRFKGLFRVLLIIPWAVPNYITALIWKWMFDSELGAINRFLEVLGIQGPEWFGQSFLANFAANLATNVWLGFPFMMVISMGALQSIPMELYEAADMDGATRWQKFRHITVPLLKPALFPAIILGTIWTFNMFNVIYLVSKGGPDNQTNILITEAYRFFNSLNQYGIAAAYCVLIFIILLCYTLITNKVSKATKGAFE